MAMFTYPIDGGSKSELGDGGVLETLSRCVVFSIMTLDSNNNYVYLHTLDVRDCMCDWA